MKAAVALGAVLLGLGGCGAGQQPGAGRSSADGDVVVDVATLTQAPRRLCASAQLRGEEEPRVWASVQRDAKWIIVVRAERGEGDSGQTWRHYFPADLAPEAPVELGCGRLLLRSARSESLVGRSSSPRVWAQALSTQSEVGATPVTLVDYHEDWEGGSGGTLVVGRVDGDRLRLTETSVSPGSGSMERRWTTTTEFDLRGLTREVVETSVASIVVSAAPLSSDAGAPSQD